MRASSPSSKYKTRILVSETQPNTVPSAVDLESGDLNSDANSALPTPAYKMMSKVAS